MHAPIMVFRTFLPIHLFVNGSPRCDSRGGQFMGDSIFLNDFPALVDAGLVG